MLNYKQLRKFDSDVYVFEFDPKKYLSQISFGKKGKYERLSDIHHSWYEKNNYKEIAKINLGFFGQGIEQYGLVMWDSGFIEGSPTGVNGVECYLDKNNNFNVEQMSKDKADQIKKDGFRWGGSLSYSLLVNGEKNFIAGSKYYHFKQRHPRTLIGQKVDKTMVLVVVDGRSKQSKGITGEQSAELLLELGCINGINADGGGSSEMIVRSSNGMEIVNKPSDGRERAIGTGLIVYSKKENIVYKKQNKIKPSGIIIAIDDGHGEDTKGKRTPVFPPNHKYAGQFMKENHFNKVVAKLLGEHLEHNGFKVLFTSPTDKDTPLQTRTDIANNKIKNKYKKSADLFISIHANAISGKWNQAKGIETFIYQKGGKTEKVGREIHERLMQGTPFYDRGLKTANFHVLRETKMLAVLVELGFMDNLREAELLMSGVYRKECAIEIANGICDYYGVEFKKAINTKENKVDNYEEKISDTIDFLVKEGIIKHAKGLDLDKPVKLGTVLELIKRVIKRSDK